MLKIHLSIFVALFGYICSASVPDTIPANNPLIEYTGRIDFSRVNAPEFSYSGVSWRACFQGTSISILMDDEADQNFYNIILDKKVTRIQTKKGLNTYEIAMGLKDTIHEVEVFRLTEQMFGKTRFCGYLVDKGRQLVEISDKRPHLIEFIGNSITCGYGNEGTLGGKFGPTTENHYLTYAAITSRNLHARHLAVCKSGIGIYRNYNADPVSGSPDCMPNFYSRIFLYDSIPLYSFKEKPDLICIDLGTNDFSTNQGDTAIYIRQYIRFIDMLQHLNKKADVLCLLGPMLSGDDLIKVRKSILRVVEMANRKNNGNVYFYEMSQQTGDLGIGIDYHPNLAQNLRNAGELTAFISKLKAWKVLQQEPKNDVIK